MLSYLGLILGLQTCQASEIYYQLFVDNPNFQSNMAFSGLDKKAIWAYKGPDTALHIPDFLLYGPIVYAGQKTWD